MKKFTSAVAKIERASSAVEGLSADAQKLCGAIQQSIVCETVDEADIKQWVYRGKRPVVPVSWSVQTGEILYNLRSALDHIVWKLVCANAQTPSRKNQFPIADDADAWKAYCRRGALDGISDRARAAIEYAQPFNPMLVLPTTEGDRPIDAQVFRILRDLCNIDKHRHLHLIVSKTDGIGPIEFGENQPPRRLSEKPLEGRGIAGEIKKGMVLFSINDAKQELNPIFNIGIYFDSKQVPNLVVETVPIVLSRCVQAVRGAEKMLRRFNRS